MLKRWCSTCKRTTSQTKHDITKPKVNGFFTALTTGIISDSNVVVGSYHRCNSCGEKN